MIIHLALLGADVPSAPKGFMRNRVDALESKDLIFKFADGTSLVVSQTLGSLLQSADHWWRAAE
jgi:hypothetical protein